jgi:hypothetical protein
MISFIFSFAPLPLTEDRSPLAHAASLARRRQMDTQSLVGTPRHRIRPLEEKVRTEAALS